MTSLVLDDVTCNREKKKKEKGEVPLNMTHYTRVNKAPLWLTPLKDAPGFFAMLCDALRFFQGLGPTGFSAATRAGPHPRKKSHRGNILAIFMQMNASEMTQMTNE